MRAAPGAAMSTDCGGPTGRASRCGCFPVSSAGEGGACAITARVLRVVASSSVPHANGLAMDSSSPAAQFRGGSEVQAVAVLPKLAVAELQVQPAYQVSLASLTAPTYVVVSNVVSMLFGSAAMRAVSLAPLMKPPFRVAANAALLFVPALNTSATCCTVTPPVPTNGPAPPPHCITTEENTGGPSFCVAGSAVRMLVPFSRRQASALVTTPFTSEASALPRMRIAAVFGVAGFRCTKVKLASFRFVRGVLSSSALAESSSIMESALPEVFCTAMRYWMPA